MTVDGEPPGRVARERQGGMTSSAVCQCLLGGQSVMASGYPSWIAQFYGEASRPLHCRGRGVRRTDAYDWNYVGVA